MFLTNFLLCNEVRLAESVDCDSNEHEADQGCDDDADDLESLEPGLSAPAHCLEHAPEAVAEVEPDHYEPCDVEDKDNRVAEYRGEEEVRIVLESSDPEETEQLRKLHLCPEMEQVEAYESNDDDSQNEHVLC